MGLACSRRTSAPASGAVTSLVPPASGAAGEANNNGVRSKGLPGGYIKSNTMPDEPTPLLGDDPSAPFAPLSSCYEAVCEEEKRRNACMTAANRAAKASLGPHVDVVRMSTVDGRLVVVLDGLVPDQVRCQLFDCLETDAFRRTEFARPETKTFRHHVVTYCARSFRQTELYMSVNRAVQAFFPPARFGGKQLEAYRIYTNAVFFADVGFVHRDSDNDQHVTALIYPNPDWTPELGGETVFYDESGVIVESVEPRPGRVVLFNGSIMHKGSPPTRLMYGARYTTAFKFAPGDEADDSDEPRPPQGGGMSDGRAALGRGGLRHRANGPP